MLVTLGVNLAKKGTVVTSRTHWQIFLTISGSWPQANPIPRSPIPWGQDKLSSSASAPDSQAILANSCQSSLSKEAMILAIMMCSGKSFFISPTPWHTKTNQLWNWYWPQNPYWLLIELSLGSLPSTRALSPAHSAHFNVCPKLFRYQSYHWFVLALAPIGSSLLRNQFNVQKGALAWSVIMSTSGATNNL